MKRAKRMPRARRLFAACAQIQKEAPLHDWVGDPVVIGGVTYASAERGRWVRREHNKCS